MFWFKSFRKFFEQLRSFEISIIGRKYCRCAADFSLLNLPKGKSLGRSKPATSSYAQALRLLLFVLAPLAPALIH